MITELLPYATGTAAVTTLGGIFSLLRLRMRLKFNRYVVDQTFKQGHQVDALAIIKATTPRAPSGERPAAGEDSAGHEPDVTTDDLGSQNVLTLVGAPWK